MSTRHREPIRVVPHSAQRRAVVPSALGLRLAAVASLVRDWDSCMSRDTEATAVQRGDQAFAQENFEEALAEYRLAIRQGADDPSVTAATGGAHVHADEPGRRRGRLLRRRHRPGPRASRIRRSPT